jgi:hypothetical protein
METINSDVFPNPRIKSRHDSCYDPDLGGETLKETTMKSTVKKLTLTKNTTKSLKLKNNIKTGGPRDTRGCGGTIVSVDQ